MNKQEQEAETIGLVLVNKADKSFGKSYLNYNLYRFKSCGHEQYSQPTHVRRNSITCTQCFENKLKFEAEINSIRLIGNSDLGCAFRLYEFIKCGHIQHMRHASIRNRETSTCKICHENNLKVEAEKQDLTYLGKSELNGVYRRYRFNKCSHIKDINSSCIPLGSFECKECVEIEKVKLCEENGLVALSTKEQYWTFRLPCGHERLLRVDHAIDDSWRCSECSDSHYTKPSIVYLYKFSCPDFEWLKLGFSRNLSIRKANYKTPINCKSELLFSLAVNTGYEAMLLEKSIHKKLKHLKLCKNFMTGYMQNNGHTECYPLSAFDQIIKELNE